MCAQGSDSICKLCLLQKKLMKSHIFPEFLYSGMYNKHHKFLVVATDPATYTKRPSLGVYEHLLCDDCEQLLGTCETHAAQVLSGQIGKQTEVPDGRAIEGLDYSLFKLFQLSVLWRCSVSTRPEFRGCVLGPHEVKLRQMLVESNPGGALDYPCLVTSSGIPDDIASQLITPPDETPSKIDGHRVFRSIFAGLFWAWMVSGHTRRYMYPQYILSEDGRLPILNADELGLGYVTGFAQDLQRAGKLPKSR